MENSCICKFDCTAIRRSEGRSVTAAIAYRIGGKIIDERTGETHDYRRKQGVEFVRDITPDSTKKTYKTADLWNRAERAETRINSVVGRAIMVALPAELTADERDKLAFSFGNRISKRYGAAVNVAVHAPDTRNGADERNHHAHITMSTRILTPEGFGQKIRVLDDKITGPEEIKALRELWADLANKALERHGSDRRMDPRSYREQGIDTLPGVHLGPTATALERKGIPTRLGDENRKIAEYNAAFAEQKNLEKEIAELKHEVTTQDKLLRSLAEEAARNARKAAEKEAEAKRIAESKKAEEEAARKLAEEAAKDHIEALKENKAWDIEAAGKATDKRGEEARLKEIAREAEAETAQKAAKIKAREERVKAEYLKSLGISVPDVEVPATTTEKPVEMTAPIDSEAEAARVADWYESYSHEYVAALEPYKDTPAGKTIRAVIAAVSVALCDMPDDAPMPDKQVSQMWDISDGIDALAASRGRAKPYLDSDRGR